MHGSREVFSTTTGHYKKLTQILALGTVFFKTASHHLKGQTPTSYQNGAGPENRNAKMLYAIAP